MGHRLSQAQIDGISQRVYARYPDLKGVRPQIKSQETGKKLQYVLSFKTRVAAADGASLQLIVRAFASESGRLLKMSSSR